MRLHDVDIISLDVEDEVNHLDINSVSFLAIIAPTNSAIKCSGSGNGGTLLLAFDDTMLPEVLKASLLREQLLEVSIKVADD